MALTGDPSGKAIINEAAQLMGSYCASPNCLNKHLDGHQFCLECLGKKNKAPKRNYQDSRQQSIYFIKQGEYVKIGYSAGIKDRLKGLQTGSPEELEVLATEHGDKLTEKWLHMLFEKQHYRGEWFKLDDELLNYIECLKQGLGIYKTCEIAFTE